ncbi:MAG TPA: hypothetical protein VJH24_03155 [Candidatus Bilamarchaeaceae archaeon]|nr:hypothetical protein [Candidatus Bilamarchaeaceae archaeon]
MKYKACPRCDKPVEASEHMNPAFLGFDALDPKITCSGCGYRGLPILLEPNSKKRG